MIRLKKDRDGRQGGAPPGPRITLQLVEGNQLRIATHWDKGEEVDLFAQLLLYLCQGKLTSSVAASVVLHAAKVGELEKGSLINSVLQQVQQAPDGDEDEPLVCPTAAIRMNMKPFQG